MIDYGLALMAGIDIPVPELQITVHPPVIKEIAYMGEQEFFSAVQYLCLEKESLVQDETLLSGMNNFQVLMKVLEQSKDKEKKNHLIMLLKLLFPDRVAMITRNSIILSAPEGGEPVMIDGNNFDLFQSVAREVLCVHNLFQGDNVIYKPANEAAKRIADKILKGRQKVATIKNKGENESVLTRYISILTIGTNSLTINDCLNLNLYQLFDLMERYNAFVEWDADLRVRLAGGKPDKQVESWMRNIHNNN